VHLSKNLKKNEKEFIKRYHMLVPKRLTLTTSLNIKKAQHTSAYKARTMHIASFILMFKGEKLFFLKIK